MKWTNCFLLISAFIMSQEIHFNDPTDYGWVPDSEPDHEHDEHNDDSANSSSFLSLLEDEDVIDNDGSDIDTPNLDNDNIDDEHEDMIGNDCSPGDFSFSDPDWIDKDFVPVSPHRFEGETADRLPDDFNTTTARPIDYFKLFVTDELVRNICHNTNKYADRVILRKKLLDNTYLDKKWYPTTVEEISAYIGMNVIFGIHPMPRTRDYWSCDPYIGNEGIKKVMTCNRYEKLCEHFHVSDRDAEIPSGAPGYDPLAKVRPIMNALLETFPLYKAPNMEQAIDEGMCAYKGRLKFVQYMPLKPVKRGIKVWIRCDAPEGYVQQFEVYLGKGSEENPSQHGALFDVVDRLTRPIRGVYHSLTFDNLYTSFPLLLFLNEHKIYATGTLRSTRKYVPQVIKKPGKMNRGAFVLCQDKNVKNLTCSVWKDTKEVRFASTKASPLHTCKTHRRVGGRYENVELPHMALIYNDYMAAVDRFDRLRGSYKTGRNSKKAWKYLFWFFIDTALVNSWLLFRKYIPEERKYYAHIHFRHEIGVQLIGGFSGNKRTQMRPPAYVQSANVTRNVSWHKNVHMFANRPRLCVHHSQLRPNGRV